MWHGTHYHYFPLYCSEIEHFVRSDHRLVHPVATAIFTPGAIISLPYEDFVAQD